LGGGLAVVASLDIAVTLRLGRGQIAVTTFGAPKVGTYSFVRRVARVVTSARRVVVAGDIVTKLPVGYPLESVFLSGWFHFGTECLLDVTGNMVLNPTVTETTMLQRGASSTSHHLRLAYATALMAWAVRSHEGEAAFDWWVLVVNNWWNKAGGRLSTIAPAVRERLLADMMRSGVTYFDGKSKVRDVGLCTGQGETDDDDKNIGSWVELRLVAGMERARETGDNAVFDALLRQLLDMRGQAKPVAEAESEDQLTAGLHATLLAGDLRRFDLLLKALEDRVPPPPTATGAAPPPPPPLPPLPPPPKTAVNEKAPAIDAVVLA